MATRIFTEGQCELALLLLRSMKRLSQREIEALMAVVISHKDNTAIRPKDSRLARGLLKRRARQLRVP